MYRAKTIFHAMVLESHKSSKCKTVEFVSDYRLKLSEKKLCFSCTDQNTIVQNAIVVTSFAMKNTTLLQVKKLQIRY